MGMSNTRAKHKSRPIGSKVNGIPIYKVSKSISRSLLYS